MIEEVRRQLGVAAIAKSRLQLGRKRRRSLDHEIAKQLALRGKRFAPHHWIRIGDGHDEVELRRAVNNQMRMSVMPRDRVLRLARQLRVVEIDVADAMDERPELLATSRVRQPLSADDDQAIAEEDEKAIAFSPIECDAAFLEDVHSAWRNAFSPSAIRRASSTNSSRSFAKTASNASPTFAAIPARDAIRISRASRWRRHCRKSASNTFTLSSSADGVNRAPTRPTPRGATSNSARTPITWPATNFATPSTRFSPATKSPRSCAPKQS